MSVGIAFVLIYGFTRAVKRRTRTSGAKDSSTACVALHWLMGASSSSARTAEVIWDGLSLDTIKPAKAACSGDKLGLYAALSM